MADVSPPAPPPAPATDRIPYPTTRRQRLRWEARRATRFARPLLPHEPAAPVPPPLPPGRTAVLPGIGEVFYRASEPVPGRLPLLLLHGWIASADLNWFRSYGPLGEHRQVIALDHQGHGRGIRSEEPFSLERAADAGAALLADLGIDRALVAGYSMGGPIALHLTHRHPQRVAGVVLGATALEWRAHPLERLQWEFLRLVEVVLRFTTGHSVIARVVRQAVDDDPTLEPWEPWLLGETKRGYLPDMIGAGRALSRYDARPFAGTLGVPTAVVLTEHDRLVRPRKQRALARALGAPVFTVDGDHDCPLVRADELNTALAAALASLEQRVPAAPVVAAR